jgi:hypothetical protein
MRRQRRAVARADGRLPRLAWTPDQRSGASSFHRLSSADVAAFGPRIFRDWRHRAAFTAYDCTAVQHGPNCFAGQVGFGLARPGAPAGSGLRSRLGRPPLQSSELCLLPARTRSLVPETVPIIPRILRITAIHDEGM